MIYLVLFETIEGVNLVLRGTVETIRRTASENSGNPRSTPPSVVFIAYAAAWLLYWLRKPLLIPRYEAIQHDRGDSLITLTDRIVGVALLGATILIVLVGFVITNTWYPVTVPLQSTWLRILLCPSNRIP
jgi:hypothetical protein